MCSHGFTCVPHPDPPTPTSLSTRFLWVFPVHQARALVSRIHPGLVICFTIDNIHVSMLYPFLKIIGLLFISLSIFFHSVDFFYFVSGFLCCTKTFKFKLGPICLFLFLPLETEPPKCCYNLCQRMFCLCFLLRGSVVSSLTFRPLILNLFLYFI